MLRIILLGPPGCGKGTQAALLEKSHGLRQISTGGILRDAIARQTPVGIEAKPYIDIGALVPNEVVNRLVAEVLRSDRPEKFLLDGYPRTLDQAQVLDDLLDQLHLPITHAVLMEVADEEVVSRISGRRVCPKCNATYHLVVKPPMVPGVCDYDQTKLLHRSDDHEETVRSRLKEYHANIQPMLPYYRQKGVLRVVPGLGTIAEVQERILQAIES